MLLTVAWVTSFGISGFSLPNCQILLLDPATGTPVEDGAAGEIVVLGIAVAEGCFVVCECDGC